jgi:two-component system cell cycle sensor histidine kinase/response regulator CckA
MNLTTAPAVEPIEARYRDMFDRSPAGIFITRPDGTIVEANRALMTLLGFDGGSCSRVNARDVYAAAADRDDLLSELKRHGRVENREVTLRRADGESIHVLLSAVGRFDGHRNLVEIEGYLIDVTNQKRVEAALYESLGQLRHAQRMEAMGRLAGGVAHDFNNLLTAILGFSELLAQDSSLPAQAREDAGQIRQCAVSASSLTRQLLAFSRKQVLKPATLDLGQVVADTGSMLRRVLGEDITLTITVPPDPVYVVADRGQLEQVMMNLAINARDAMSADGRLEITVKASDTHVSLDVSDTGCGIPADVLPQIFEPFFTTKPSGEGTGLGLATVYGIVTQSGGTIDVASVEARGTTFSIGLPRFTGTLEAGARSAEVRAKHGRETVLVVEDEEAVRTVVRHVLEHHGYSVVMAEDAASALRFMEQRHAHIDLVLSDVVLPGMNGPELLAHVNAAHPDVRVLLMSGYSAKRGCHLPSVPRDVPLLTKPFTPIALAGLVRQVLDTTREAPAVVH